MAVFLSQKERDASQKRAAIRVESQDEALVSREVRLLGRLMCPRVSIRELEELNQPNASVLLVHWFIIAS